MPKETLRQQVERLKQELQDKQSAWNSEKDSYDAQLTQIRGENEQKTKEINEKQKMLDKRELTALAQAYDDQEKQFKKSADNWLAASVVASVVIIFGWAKFSAHLSSIDWIDRINYALPVAVIVTLWIFSGRQYGYFRKLQTDFANRRTLAQSYQNLISASGAEQEIKEQFFERVSSILCAPCDSSVDTTTLLEKSLETLTEVAKLIPKK